MSDQRVQVVGNQLGREVKRRQIELSHRGVPYPERGASLADGYDELAAQAGPAGVDGNSVPATGTRVSNGVERGDRAAAPPDIDGLARRAAGLLVKHVARITIVRQECTGIGAHLVFLEDRPILQELPRRSVAAAAPRVPVVAVVRDPRGRAMQHIRDSFVAPFVPLCGRPSIAGERFFDQLLAFRSIAPPLEIPAAQGGGRRAGARRKLMVESQQLGVHADLRCPVVNAARTGTSDSRAALCQRPASSVARKLFM